MKIKYKLIFLILTLLISTLGSITFFLNRYFENTIISQTYTTCNSLSILITGASREELFIGVSNFENLENILNTVKSSNIFGLKKIYVVNTKGIIVISSNQNEIEKKLNDNEIFYLSKIDKLSLLEIENNNEKILKYTSPIFLEINGENYKLGAAVFEFSKNELFLPLENLKIRIFNISLFILLVSIIISLITSYLLTKPIEKLKIGIENYSKGDLSYQIEISSKDEFGSLAKNFNNMSQKLKEIDRLKDEFLANTSHELKTPLNGIIGIAESLRYDSTGIQSKNTIENLDFIISSGKRLNNLVNDILDYSIIKKNQIILNKNNINFYVICDLVITLLKRGSKNINLEIINNIPDTLPQIYADENRVQQILFNIIGNALKFTKSGEIEISASEGLTYPIDRKGEKILPKVIVSIRDTGIGIPEEKISSIFNQFEQVDSSIQRNYGGTGLGLAITKKLLELHDCNIWLESKLGVGTTFYFTLPISNNQNSPPVNLNKNDFILSSDPQNSNNLTFSKDGKVENPNILIIDDEPINIHVIRNHLIDMNYNIFYSHNGREGLSIIKENRIDLVLLDLMMPEFTGFEFTEIIRKSHDLSKLPIIIITARNQLSDFLSAFSYGVNDYISKPISREELISRVRTQIELKKLNDNLELLVLDRTAELSKVKKEIESINIFTRIINEHSNMKEVFINISQYLFINFEIEASILFLLSENKNFLECFRFYSYFKISEELIEYIESRKFPIHIDSVVNFVSKRKKPFFFQNLKDSKNEMDNEFANKVGIESGLFIPLVIQSETIGLYLLTNISKNFEIKRKKIYSINNFLRQTAGTINGIRLLIESNRAKLQLNEEKIKLENTMYELERTQEELLKSEKLATMGQLISNVSHELNTPIGAIKATSVNIKNSVIEILSIFKSSLKTQENEENHIKIELIEKTIENIFRVSSTKIDRENRKNLKMTLSKFQLSNETEILNILTDLKFSDVDEKIILFLQIESNFDFLVMLYNLSGLLNKSNIIESSVEKTSKIIFALKNFTGDTIFSKKTVYNFSHRLKSTIDSFKSFTTKGIEFIEKFNANPESFCHPEELDQVWKNLINNSIHAISGIGSITIELSVISHQFEYSPNEINSTFISIHDTGNGIPENLQNKIFQPFFTTKNSGDGSGMGLYLCKKIIEKHNGEIHFNSKEGSTFFNIFIPIVEN